MITGEVDHEPEFKRIDPAPSSPSRATADFIKSLPALAARRAAGAGGPEGPRANPGR